MHGKFISCSAFALQHAWANDMAPMHMLPCMRPPRVAARSWREAEAVLTSASASLHASQAYMCSCMHADMRIFVYDVEKALAGSKEGLLRANINVGEEPVAYCLVCPNGSTVLSCDDDGQLETWCIKTGVNSSLRAGEGGMRWGACAER
eukprot:356692-Chlamydomonas_euryale.AAC.2